MGLSSMTGFGAGDAADGDERVEVELKSVNGKFCEVKARLPRELAALETEVVKLIKDRLARGNVDVLVRRRSTAAGATVAKVNGDALTALTQALTDAARHARLDPHLRIGELLVVPGLVALEEAPPDLETARRALQKAVGDALDRLVEARAREGAALGAELSSRLSLVRAQAAKIRELVPQTVEQHREKLRARIAELVGGGEVDAGRIELEVAVFADRTDVTEELTRIGAHCDEIERLLGESGPAGRRLEFLFQELGREVNTTGAKSQSAAIAQLVVDAKAELERLREQVQNVE